MCKLWTCTYYSFIHEYLSFHAFILNLTYKYGRVNIGVQSGGRRSFALPPSQDCSRFNQNGIFFHFHHLTTLCTPLRENVYVCPVIWSEECKALSLLLKLTYTCMYIHTEILKIKCYKQPATKIVYIHIANVANVIFNNNFCF